MIRTATKKRTVRTRKATSDNGGTLRQLEGANWTLELPTPQIQRLQGPYDSGGKYSQSFPWAISEYHLWHHSFSRTEANWPQHTVFGSVCWSTLAKSASRSRRTPVRRSEDQYRTPTWQSCAFPSSSWRKNELFAVNVNVIPYLLNLLSVSWMCGNFSLNLSLISLFRSDGFT